MWKNWIAHMLLVECKMTQADLRANVLDIIY